METRQIVVKFNVGKGFISLFLYWILGHTYTHAAIKPAEEEMFYSFQFQGFRKERGSLRAKPTPKWNSPKTYIFIEVSEQQYACIQQRLHEVSMDESGYRYNFIGLILSFAHISYHPRNHYFCSQFVAETLGQAGVLNLKKSESLYFPHQLKKEVASLQDIEQISFA